MSYRQNQRDLNEREIISTLVAAGAYVKQMDRHAGFDLLVCHAGVVYVAEVKAPGGRFTQAELDTEAAVTATGCKYWVLRDFMDALRMIEMAWTKEVWTKEEIEEAEKKAERFAKLFEDDNG